MVDTTNRNDDIVWRMMRGASMREAAGPAYEAVRKSLRKENRESGASWMQRAVYEVLIRIGLWQSADDAGRERTAQEQRQMQDETDYALGGIVPSYMVTPPPELQIVYSNPQVSRLYRMRQTDADGVPLLTFICDARMHGRVRSEGAARHHAGLAMGILKLSELMGSRENARTRRMLEPFLAFAAEHFPHLLTDSNETDVIASLYGTYETEMRHWERAKERGEAVLRYRVSWRYRPEWRLLQVLYEPADDPTRDQMWEMVNELVEMGVLDRERLG